MKKFLFFAFLVIIGNVITFFALTYEKDPLKVVFNNTIGDKINVDKYDISITFNKDVVIFGSIVEEENFSKKIFEITPHVTCDFKWISPNKLQCILNEKLNYATKYKIKISKNFTAQDRTSLRSDYVSTFETEKAKAIVSSNKPTKDSILIPRHAIWFNTDIDPTTLNISYRFYNKKIDAKIQCFNKKGNEGSINTSFDSEQSKKEDKEKFKNVKIDFCFILPKKDLPYNTNISICQEKGLKTQLANSLESKEEKIFDFKIDDKYAGELKSDYIKPNKKEFLVFILKELKDYQISFVANQKEYGAKIKEIKNIDKNIKNLIPYVYREDLEKINVLKITSKESLPYDSDINLIIRNIKTKNNTSLKDKNISTFRTYSKKFSFLNLECYDAEKKEYVKAGRYDKRTCDKLQFNSILKRNSQVKIKFQKNNEKVRSAKFNCGVGEYGYCYMDFIGSGKIKILNINAIDIFNRKFNKKVKRVRFESKDMQPWCDFDNYYYTHRVLEKDEDSDLPVEVTNVEEFKFDYYLLSSKGRQILNNKTIKVPFIRNHPHLIMPIGIKNLLNGKSGYLEGEVQCKDIKQNKKHFIVQVTPFNVFYKFGATNSLVWVTSLKTGKPIKNANVSIILDGMKKGIGIDYKILQEGKTNDDGIAIFKGINKLDPKYKFHYDYDDKKLLIVKVTKGKDLAIMPLNDNFIERWGNYNNTWKYEHWDERYKHYLYRDLNNIRYWGTTTQGVYKRGDVVNLKIIVRDIKDDYVKIPPLEKKYNIIIRGPHDVAGEIKNIKLSEYGTYAGEFLLSKHASGGEYYIIVEDLDGNKARCVNSIRFLVTDFVPASYKGRVIFNKKKYYAGEIATVDINAKFYSGGPLSYGNVGVTAMLYPKEMNPKNKKLREFDFSESYINKEFFDYTASRYRGGGYYEFVKHNLHDSLELLSKNNLKLDKNGNLKYQFPINFGYGKRISIGNIVVTSNIQDERGKTVSFESSAEYVDYDRFLGQKKKKGIDVNTFRNESYETDYVVIDENENIVKVDDIKISVYKKEEKEIREKNAYGNYDTKYFAKLKKVKDYNYKIKDENFKFKFKPRKLTKSDKNKLYIIASEIKDTRGNVYSVVDYFYSSFYEPYVSDDERGKDEFKIYPLKKSYKVGDEAKIKIENPYPNSYVLITKERFGILKHFVKFLKSKEEIISLHIDEDDLPGFNITANLMRKRDKKAKLEEVLRWGNPVGWDDGDKGRPFIATAKNEIFVKGDDKELDVKINIDKNEYRPSSKVNVSLTVQNKKHEGVESEVSLICLDESVYNLIQEGFNYFNPYYYFKGLLGKDSYIMNFSLISGLLGRVKFQKGLTPSGDGGEETNARKNFKYVAYWNPSVITNKEGKASVSFKLPDNLTSFKVIAIAVDKKDKMGVNSNVFKVNKPTEIRSIMPNQVRVGDKFEARFQVLNKSNEKKGYEIIYSYKQGVRGNKNVDKKRVFINPFERYILSTPVDVKEKKNIYFNVFAKEINNNDNQDGLVANVKVLRIRNKETVRFSDKLIATKEGNKREINVKLPNGIAKGILKINASTIVLNSLEGVFEYMRDYPHPCWEQKLSRALVSAYYEEFKDYVPKSFVWKNGGKLFTEKMLKLAKDYQAPMGGMTFFEPDNGNISTYLSAFTLFGFDTLKTLGYTIPKNVEDKLHEYLKKLILKESDLVSRTLVVSELYKNKQVGKSEVLRLYNDKDNMDLFSKTYLLNALSFGIKNKENLTKEAAQIFRDITNYGNETADAISFKDAKKTYNWYDLYTNTKTNCAILSAFVNYANVLKEGNEDKNYIDNNIYKLFNYVLKSRDSDGSFYNTQENIFCLKGILDYIKTYEKVSPDIEFKTLFLNKEVANFKLSKQDKKENLIKLKKEDSNKEGDLKFSAKGNGKVYYSAEISYFSINPLKEKNAGMSVKREYSVRTEDGFKLVKNGDVLNIGDTVRVDLYINIPRVTSFVAITDPLPGALEPVNNELLGGLLLTNKQNNYPKDSLYNKNNNYREYGFYHKEIFHDSVNFYSEYLNSGDYHISYLTEVVAKGKFQAGASYVEEMYSPDVFGRGTERSFEVK